MELLRVRVGDVTWNIPIFDAKDANPDNVHCQWCGNRSYAYAHCGGPTT